MLERLQLHLRLLLIFCGANRFQPVSTAIFDVFELFFYVKSSVGHARIHCHGDQAKRFKV